MCSPSETDGFDCKFCAFKSLSARVMSNHYLSEHKNKNHFVCDLCDFKTRLPFKIKEHQIIKHSAILSDRPSVRSKLNDDSGIETNQDSNSSEDSYFQRKSEVNSERTSKNHTSNISPSLCEDTINVIKRVIKPNDPKRPKTDSDDHSQKFQSDAKSDQNNANLILKENQFKCDNDCSFTSPLKVTMANHLINSHFFNHGPNFNPKALEDFPLTKNSTTFLDEVVSKENDKKSLDEPNLIKKDPIIKRCQVTLEKIDTADYPKYAGEAPPPIWVGSKRKFQCEKCSFSTNFQMFLKNHEEICTSSPYFKFSCRICGFKSNGTRALKMHVEIDHYKILPQRKCVPGLDGHMIP